MKVSQMQIAAALVAIATADAQGSLRATEQRDLVSGMKRAYTRRIMHRLQMVHCVACGILSCLTSYRTFVLFSTVTGIMD